MLFLVLLQTLLLLALGALVLYWRLQTSRRLDHLNLLESKNLSALGTVQASVAMLQAEVAELRDGAIRLEQQPPTPQSPIDPHPQPASALSIHKRSQALKMIRRGDSVDLIAAAVGAPQSQIRLLQKVHALST